MDKIKCYLAIDDKGNSFSALEQRAARRHALYEVRHNTTNYFYIYAVDVKGEKQYLEAVRAPRKSNLRKYTRYTTTAPGRN